MLTGGLNKHTMRGKNRKGRAGGENDIAHLHLTFSFFLKRSNCPPLSRIVGDLCFKKVDPVRWTKNEIPLAISSEVVGGCGIDSLQFVLVGPGELAAGDALKV